MLCTRGALLVFRDEARRIILAQPWRESMTIVLRDGTKRTGRLKHRNPRTFSLSDDIWSIDYADVVKIRSSEDHDA